MTNAPASPFPPLRALAAEEEALVFTGFDESDAWRLGGYAVQRGRAEGAPLSIGIWAGGRQLFHCALAGSTRDNDEWLRRKGRVVLRFGHSSLYMGQLCRDQNTTLLEKFALPPERFSAAGGAFPLRVVGTGVVGWFGVSGLTQVEDHEFVAAVISTFMASATRGS